MVLVHVSSYGSKRLKVTCISEANSDYPCAGSISSSGERGWRRQQVLRLKVRCSKFDVESSGASIGPDFVFHRRHVAVFVDGCFWHGCPIHSPPARWLRNSEMPATAGSRTGSKSRSTGKQFWRAKLAANRARDRYVTGCLRRRGWRVVRIWEHDLAQAPAACTLKIRRALTESHPSFPTSEARKR